MEECYLDFIKASDPINHHLLTNKIRSFGMGVPAFIWVIVFLTSGTPYVKVETGPFRTT